MMQRRRPAYHLRQKKPGTAPGTLIAPDGAHPPRIRVMAYNADTIEECEIATPDEIAPLLKKWPVIWVDVEGLGSVETLESLGRIFKLHPLALEDSLNPHHRPKAEDYGDHLFAIGRMVALKNGLLDIEQINLFLGKNFVLTVQERPGDCLDPVRARIRTGLGRRIRMLKTDYLAYAIMDTIIDGYFPVLEEYGMRLDTLEDAVVANPDRMLIASTHDIRRDLQTVRHALWPMREMINALSANEALVKGETRLFLRDCHDHIIQIIDILEIYRERSSGLVDIYLSSISNKTNEIMRMLTIISTIFIPLSFIAGVYGMNFDPDTSPLNMPELRWVYGYPFALFLMLITAGILLYYFFRKGWLGWRPAKGKGSPP